MQPATSAVIAAAGLGSRLGLGLPKCMLELEGKTILSRLIDTLRPFVERIHVVVGYREDLVIDYCARHHRDVVLVRNPDFRTTNTGYSYALGAVGLEGKVLYLDGDLIIDPNSLYRFLELSVRHDILVGITPSKSENAVYARVDADGANIIEFTRTVASHAEWANVFCGSPTIMSNAKGYVYEKLTEHLPLPVCNLELAEIDTAADLELAKQFAISRNV